MNNRLIPFWRIINRISFLKLTLKSFLLWGLFPVEEIELFWNFWNFQKLQKSFFTSEAQNVVDRSVTVWTLDFEDLFESIFDPNSKKKMNPRNGDGSKADFRWRNHRSLSKHSDVSPNKNRISRHITLVHSNVQVNNLDTLYLSAQLWLKSGLEGQKADFGQSYSCHECPSRPESSPC